MRCGGQIFWHESSITYACTSFHELRYDLTGENVGVPHLMTYPILSGATTLRLRSLNPKESNQSDYYGSGFGVRTAACLWAAGKSWWQLSMREVAANPALTADFARTLQGAIDHRPALTTTSWAAVVGDCSQEVSAFGGVDAAGEPTSISTWFDLASLTKVLVTVPLALELVGKGVLDPEEPLADLLPDAGWQWMGDDCHLGTATLLDLLSHSAGVAATEPIYSWGTSSEQAIARILHASSTPQQSWSDGIRRGTGYSDLGYLIAGEVMSAVTQQTFQALALNFVKDTGIQEISYGVDADRNSVAPMGYCRFRKRELVGTVHDLNAASLGGVTPHAGLFGTLAGVQKALEYLQETETFGVVSKLRSTPDPVRQPRQTSRGLGWELPCAAWSRGTYVLPRGICHIGSTGTSVWIDHDGAHQILLTNRTGFLNEGYVKAVDGLRRVFAAVSDGLLVDR